MNLEEIRKSFFSELVLTKSEAALEVLRVKYLGRDRGMLTAVLRSLGGRPLEEKKRISPEANRLRDEIESALRKKSTELRSGGGKPENFDVTMPGLKIPRGSLHPLTLLETEIKNIFLGLHFSVVEGPEVENEYYNFDALNIPAGHPARDMWDTFWLDSKLETLRQKRISLGLKNSKLLLRTHTSPMQIRFMEQHKPPFQVIVPGRVFRFEATDASHEINFYQVEGLMVGTDVTLANFKFVIKKFIQELFGLDTEIRFRPSYFPFVEPGLEVDIKLRGKWLEVMGAGMVHPNVFKAVGYPIKGANRVRGFAFGLGLDRFAMIKFGIPDVRLFYNGDLRMIQQF